MLAYTAKRLLTLIPTLLAASVLVFLFVHLIPGDPAAILLGDTATPEEVAQDLVMHKAEVEEIEYEGKNLEKVFI